MADSDEKRWGAISHTVPLVASALSMGTLGWVASIAILLTKGKNSHFVRFHCLQQMIFQILLTITVIIGGILTFVLIGWPILIAACIAGLIFPILAAIRASEGREYGLPVAGHIARSIRGS
jgi:uncharacterized membrane protein